MNCTKCKSDKPPEAFAKNRTMRRGYSYWCKACMKLCLAEYHRKHGYPAQQKYGRRNPEKIKAMNVAWNAANKERRAATIQAWGRSAAGRAKVVRRRAIKARAIPQWADSKKILDVYKARIAAQELFGVMVHVDHAVPLQSDFVCGLHCEDNLVLLPAIDNLVKSNTIWPDMWEAA